MSSRIQEEEIIDNTAEGTGRIEAFSDGVIAIAITLLILEIKVPQTKEGETGHLLESLFKLWPSYGGYFTSFLVIGIIWINHHQMYKLIERTNHAFLALNVLFLMIVSFIPFPTAVLAESIRDGHEQQAAVIFYAGVMWAMAIAYNVLWRYAKNKRHRLIDQKVSPLLLKGIMQKYNMGLLLYAVAFGLAFISYEVSLGLIVFLALYFLSPGLPGLTRATDAKSPSS